MELMEKVPLVGASREKVSLDAVVGRRNRPNFVGPDVREIPVNQVR